MAVLSVPLHVDDDDIQIISSKICITIEDDDDLAVVAPAPVVKQINQIDNQEINMVDCIAPKRPSLAPAAVFNEEIVILDDDEPEMIVQSPILIKNEIPKRTAGVVKAPIAVLEEEIIILDEDEPVTTKPANIIEETPIIDCFEDVCEVGAFFAAAENECPENVPIERNLKRKAEEEGQCDEEILNYEDVPVAVLEVEISSDEEASNDGFLEILKEEDVPEAVMEVEVISEGEASNQGQN